MLLTKTPYLLFILFVLLQTNLPAFSQNKALHLDEWIKRLDADNDTLNKSFDEIVNILMRMDTAIVFRTLYVLEENGSSKGPYFQVRIKHLRATMLWKIRDKVAKDSISQLMKPALQLAYAIGDEYLIANVSWWYGETMFFCKQIELSTMYCLNAVEYLDKKGITNQSDKYQFLGQLLYTTRDYDRSIYYARRAIENEKDTSNASRVSNISRWNTIALCWQKIGNYDSALHYYDIAMQMANALNSEVWKGIISGNKGYIYFLQKKYDLAKPVFEFDYSTSKQYDEIANAAHALQLIARINLLQGKKDSALLQVKEALHMLQQEPQPIPYFLQNVYYATADVYRVMGNSDSFYHYSQLYSNLHDSIERSVENSRLEISRLRLDDQSNVFKLQLLQSEKDAEERERNFVIAAIVLVAMVGLLILYRRYRIKQRHHMELVAKQREINEKNETLRNLVKDKDLLIADKDSLLKEKEWLVKEIHHRVKNNLQMVISLLNAQSEFLNSPSALNAIRESRERMQAIALLHQKLYKADNSSAINMRSYVNELVEYIKSSIANSFRINFEVEVVDVSLDISQSVPIGLILNEAVTNAIKYAYPDNEKGSISISLQYDGMQQLQLKVVDYGKGLPPDIDTDQSNSLGLQLIKLFSEQLDADLYFISKKGLEIIVNFRIAEHKPIISGVSA